MKAERYITFNNQTLSIPEWSKKTGISACAIYSRIFVYKWPMEEVMTKPPKWNGAGVRFGTPKSAEEKLMELFVAGIRAKYMANLRKVVKEIKEHDKNNHLKVA